jgi:uncharacterized membrane protein YbhN (UPF0104 family)
VPVVLVAAGCVYLARTVDVGQLTTSLLAVRAWPLLLAVAFAALGVVAHAAYWRLLVSTVVPVSLRAMTVYTFASYATNVLPMRAGEVLRVWLLQRRHDVPVALSGAIIAIEKVADLTSLLLLISPLPWLIPDLPASVGRWLMILPGIMVASVVAILIANRHAVRWKLLSGFKVVRRPGVIVAGFGCVLLAWLLDVAAILSVLVAVHVAPTLQRALVVILSVNITISVPVTVGQVGAHELGSTLALQLVGVSRAAAIPFALFYHATQLLPILVIGLSIARALSRAEGQPAPSPGASGAGPRAA